MERAPRLGDHVHYVGADGRTRAAVVTRVVKPGLVNLWVFKHDRSDPAREQVESIAQGERERNRPNSWHWPEG